MGRKKKPKKDKEKRESRKKKEKELHAVIGSITDLFNMQIPFEFYFLINTPWILELNNFVE